MTFFKGSNASRDAIMVVGAGATVAAAAAAARPIGADDVGRFVLAVVEVAGAD